MDEILRLQELVTSLAAVIRATTAHQCHSCCQTACRGKLTEGCCCCHDGADHPILRRLQEAALPERNVVLEQLQQTRLLFQARPDPLRFVDLVVEAVGGAMQSQVRPVLEALAAQRDRQLPYELPRPDGTSPKIDASNRIFGYCQTASVSEVLEMVDRAILKAA